MKDQLETEATLMLEHRSHKASHRFLDAALTFGVEHEHEPAGLLADSRKCSRYEGSVELNSR